MLNLTGHEIPSAHKRTKILNKEIVFALAHPTVVYILLINVKMPIILFGGILTFMSRINSMLC